MANTHGNYLFVGATLPSLLQNIRGSDHLLIACINIFVIIMNSYLISCVCYSLSPISPDTMLPWIVRDTPPNSRCTLYTWASVAECACALCTC